MAGQFIPQAGSGGAAGRVVTKSATSGQQEVTVTATPGVGAYPAWGSWAALTASSSAEWLLVGLWIRTASQSASNEYPLVAALGTGAAGSEVEIGRVPVVEGPIQSGAVNSGSADLAVPLRVPASTRIAVRLSLFSAPTSAPSCTVGLLYVPWANLEGN